jgi:hypothetical protein
MPTEFTWSATTVITRCRKVNVFRFNILRLISTRMGPENVHWASPGMTARIIEYHRRSGWLQSPSHRRSPRNSSRPRQNCFQGGCPVPGLSSSASRHESPQTDSGGKVGKRSASSMPSTVCRADDSGDRCHHDGDGWLWDSGTALRTAQATGSRTPH